MIFPAISRRLKNRQGVTLIEILVVITMIGIMAAFATPAILQMLPNIRIRSAARDMYSTMQEAKINAAKENKDWAIVFDSAANTYALCDSPGPPSPPAPIPPTWDTLADNHCIKTISLANYKDGIRIGHGDPADPNTPTKDIAGTNWPSGDVSYSLPPTNATIATFNARGSGNAGYVYIQNDKNTAFAVGTTTSGRLRIVSWRKGAWR